MKQQSQPQQHSGVFSYSLSSHLRALIFALGELIRSPIASMVTISIIGIAIALPLGFFILLQNVQVINSSWSVSAPTISLYLKTQTSPAQADALLQSLRLNSQIEKATYISPEAGLQTFEKNTPFGDVVKLFQKNPIPGVIVILPTRQNQNPTSIQSLYLSLKSTPLIDTAQLDINWVTRIYNIIAIGREFTKALSILFALGVVLIIGHSLRASLLSHTKEIQLLKLVGATHAYIRRPLLYRGILYGFLGGMSATVAVNCFMMALQNPVAQLAHTYQTSFQLKIISVSQIGVVLLFSVLLGLITAFFITTQFLNQPETME